MIKRSVLGLVGLIVFGSIAFAQQNPLAPIQGYDQRPPGTRPIESYEQRQRDQQQYQQQPQGNIQQYSAPMPSPAPLISPALPSMH